jgi:uncharacterized membrane protein YgdD (TMEM256/DUF423 family)
MTDFPFLLHLMNSSLPLRIAAVLGFLGVALGAFGAHGLKPLLAQTGHTDEWKTAALYHLVHAVVLLVIASRATVPRAAWGLILTGTLLFSGSLYLYATMNVSWFAHITPFGGLFLLAGWLALALKPCA